VLSLDELKRLSVAIRDRKVIEREGAYAVAAVRFLLLTGRRKEECLRLRWDQLSDDMTLMAVHDHKASRLRGTVYYALSESTARLLASLPRIEKNPHVFASTVKEGGHLVAIDETWRRICRVAGIEGARIHDLRRTHSTHAAELGVELLSTSRMLGHSSVKVTESVYTKIEAKSLRPVANRVASSLAAILDGDAKQHAA
jgi:integrase